MVAQHYRWDFIGLSTDTKPTPATSNKVVDGSTFYCSDNSKLYVWCKTQWYEKTATGGGGTSDFNDLTNRPKLMGDAMDGDTNIDSFVGTSGGSDGGAGLVPSPEASDAGKFLCADGTWQNVGGGGGINSVTRADYDYPSDNPYGISAWNLPDGMYKNTDENYVEICYSTNYTHRVQSGDCFVVMRQGFGTVLIVFGTDSYNNLYYTTCRSDGTVGQEFSALNLKRIINELTYTSSGCALDARQGKALKDLIDALDVRVTALGG